MKRKSRVIRQNRAYTVTDPATLRKRVGLLSNRPVTMMVEAVKTADLPPFPVFPQQSDYVAIWNQAPPPERKRF